jgi:hypothetical protein
MPREDRRIIFDMSETYQALYKLSLKKDDAPRLIAGHISKIEEDGVDDTSLHFFILNSQDGTKKMVTYSRDFVAAALMIHCRGLGIPLPRKAGKTVMLRDGEVILRVIV